MTTPIQELLPFYVNATLEGEDKARIEQAIKDDPFLQDEIELLTKLRGEIQGQQFENSPGELGLKRLQKSIEAENLKNDPVARARSKITKEQNWHWRAAAIAACLLLMLQTIVTYSVWQSGDLSAAGGNQIMQVSGPILSVTFVPSAREDNIRRLLLTVEATIIDGPSALGVYKISVPKDAQAALDKLRAHKNLIETADFETGQKVDP